MKNFNDYIVDTNVLKQNILNIKKLIDKNTKVCAIVKANAYGIGLETVCKTLANQIDYFGVANLKEALEIREFDKHSKILILGMINIDDLNVCSDNNISISVSNLEMLEEIALNANLPINVHLQVNTGLNRFGFRSVNSFKKALKLIKDSYYIELEGVYSHFATKSQDVSFIKRQFIRFNQFKKLVKSKVLFHICNSYGLTFNKKFHLDMVRPGFLMYGGMENSLGNKLAVTIKSKVVNICTIKKGDTVGYDRTYMAKNKMQLAIIPIGYADGYDRRLSNNFYVLINGEKCNIVGLICMDVFMVDITGKNVRLGDEVVVLGKQGKREITLQNFSEVLDTSPYEVLLKFNYKRMNYIIK